MIKQLSHPPLVILLDILFIFLFILILDSSKNLQIHIPDDKLFKGAEIIFQKNTHYYHANSGKKYSPSNFELLQPCDTQQECNAAYHQYGEKIYILIPDDIFNGIARLTTAIVLNPECNANKTTYFINQDGTLDYKKILDENPCLAHMPNFLALVDKNSTNPI